MSDALQIRGLVTGHITGIPVVHGIDLDIPSGKVTGLIGRNGAGKSTVAAAVAGVLRTWSGSVSLDGWDCTGESARARVRHGLVTVPENRQLFGQMTVIENLRVAAYCARTALTPELRQEIETRYPVITRKAEVRAGALSGGEQQMVALARAQVARPRFLVLDEPSLGLSPAITRQLGETIASFADDGVGVLLIEQNVSLIERLCDQVKLLDEGRVRREMQATELAARDDIAAVYLGVVDADEPAQTGAEGDR